MFGQRLTSAATEFKQRLIAGAVVALAASLVVPVVLDRLGHASADAPQTSVDWQPCTGAADVDCGTLNVPVDWSQTGGDTIDMAVARRKATDQSHRIGTLVIFPGGPGASGVDTLIKGRLSPEVNSRFDIVSFDPRGTNRSHPVMCDASLLSNPPNTIPGTQDQFQALLAYNKALGDSCRKDTGGLIDHVDSADVARDVDALRQAMGEDKITVYGISYGTLAGEMYAENFPTHLRAMVLDSTIDHSLNGHDQLASASRAAEDAFDQFSNWCATDSACALNGSDVNSVFDQLWALASQGQLYEPGHPERHIAPLDLGDMVIGGMMAPRSQALANQLKALADEATAQTQPTSPTDPVGSPSGQSDTATSSPDPANGSTDQQTTSPDPADGGTDQQTTSPDLAANSLDLAADGPGPEASSPAPAMSSPAPAMSSSAPDGGTARFPHAMICGDGGFDDLTSAEQLAQEWQNQNAIAPHLRTSSFGWSMATLCLNWPGSTANPRHALNITTAAPILVLNGAHDPATPLEWAANVAQQAHGTLLTYDGWGHGSYVRSDCTTGAADSFLVDLTVPPADTHCAAVPSIGGNGSVSAANPPSSLPSDPSDSFLLAPDLG